MIVDSKVPIPMYPPPPSYDAVTAAQPNRRGPSDPLATFASLPPHILLDIVYSTFPQTSSIDHGKIERQRKTLLWLVNSLRLVNRSLYIACMHLLRSTYLPAYQSLIRPPYTSDPFPTTSNPMPAATSNPSASTTSLSSSSSSSSSAATPQPITSIQRETLILDRFIALKVRQDVLADDSELHLEREDMFKDLFDHAQPKARLEDLVRQYGVKEGVISLPGVSTVSGGAAQQREEGGSASAKSSPAQSTSNLLSHVNTTGTGTNNTPTPRPLSPLSPVRPSPPPNSASRPSRFFNFFSSAKLSVVPTPYPPPPPSPSTPVHQARPKINPVPFASISISLAPRTINLVVGSGVNRRTLASVQREGREMKLETGARRLVRELKNLLVTRAEE